MDGLGADAGAEVAAAFGLGSHAHLTGPVAAGHVGAVHRLTTDRGRFAVKVQPATVRESDVAADAAYQDAVRAAGVPAPEVRRTVDGAVLGTVGGSVVRVHDWVDVLPATRGLDPVAVGTLVARLHRVVVPAVGEPRPWLRAAVPARDWVDLLDRLRAAGAPFAGELAALLPDLTATAALVRPPGDLQTCHGDLWTDNLLRTPTGGLVVLDWEQCGPGSPTRELAQVAYEVGDGDAGRVAVLVTAYAEAGGPGRLRGLADCGTLVAQLSHITRTGCETWLSARAADDAAGCRAAEAWVREFVDQPVTLTSLEWLVAAARRADG